MRSPPFYAGTMATDLAEFLCARLDEDEAAARFAELLWGETVADNSRAERQARALREVEAKRAIVALHRTETTYCESRDDDGRPVKNPEVQCFVCGWASDVGGSACETLRQLAAVYAAHPDYRPEWTP